MGRIKMVTVRPDLLEEAFRTGATVAFHVMKGLPNDAEFARAYAMQRRNAAGSESVLAIEFSSRGYAEIDGDDLIPEEPVEIWKLNVHGMLRALRDADRALEEAREMLGVLEDNGGHDGLIDHIDAARVAARMVFNALPPEAKT